MRSSSVITCCRRTEASEESTECRACGRVDQIGRSELQSKITTHKARANEAKKDGQDSYRMAEGLHYVFLGESSLEQSLPHPMKTAFQI
ncbi:hypothetical protein GCK72_024300 [Caenorhabditis remanei]|uniref:Uncharacterized protein n=1 Tax=Caenorhabditis remanei TaxID=31234 RepID=A0A6A5FZH6_CAERE|nr:hypothetical protein GCK72_024300 [Caenorhabditis remanei]KAF1747834.1 hypothetical protein GCK72_024300 [Caenorhabditis remanei]